MKVKRLTLLLAGLVGVLLVLILGTGIYLYFARFYYCYSLSGKLWENLEQTALYIDETELYTDYWLYNGHYARVSANKTDIMQFHPDQHFYELYREGELVGLMISYPKWSGRLEYHWFDLED